jgi:hypothetical protein
MQAAQDGALLIDGTRQSGQDVRTQNGARGASHVARARARANRRRPSAGCARAAR